MLKSNKIFLLLIVYSFLLGCAIKQPNQTKLGISSVEWESYSKKKQKELLRAYAKSDTFRRVVITNSEAQDYEGVFLKVDIYDGKAMFPPDFINWQKYKPVQFTIFEGQCREIEIVSYNNDNTKTKLWTCFNDNTLYLDPSNYELTEPQSYISIHSSPLWQKGFVYQGINSKGYVRLNNVKVKVKRSQ